MKVIDPGHVYWLGILDAEQWDAPISLRFVKREGDKYPGNVGHHPGTTTQEVLCALIDRMLYVDKQISDDRNRIVIANLRSAIFFLEKRAADRHGLLDKFEEEVAQSTQHIETFPTCQECGHIICPHVAQ